MQYLIYSDGGCPNNGRGAQNMFGSFAVYRLTSEGYSEKLHDMLTLVDPEHYSGRMDIPTINKYCGATNNVAEASMLHTALTYAKNHGLLSPGNTVHVCMDSEIILNQVTKAYRTKNPYLRQIHEQVWRMLSDHGKAIGMNVGKILRFHWISGDVMKKTILRH